MISYSTLGIRPRNPPGPGPEVAGSVLRWLMTIPGMALASDKSSEFVRRKGNTHRIHGIHGTNDKFSYMGWLNFMGISCRYILFVPWICIWEGSSFVNMDFLEIKGLKVPRVLDINKGRKTKSSCWCVFHAILRPWHPVISENDG